MRDFLSAEPFPHLVIDDFLSSPLAEAAAAEFGRIPPDAWHRYDSTDERNKWACRDWAAIEAHAPACHDVLRDLTSSAAAAIAGALADLDGLSPDPELYGGGLHSMGRGGRLGVHLDNERHPSTGLTRRLNLIVYLTPWSKSWGGHLEFWDRARGGAVQKILPRFNRAVLFETGARSYHGQPSPLVCPEGVRRNSLAVFYWSPPRPRARFVSIAGEPSDASREAARLARSGLS